MIGIALDDVGDDPAQRRLEIFAHELVFRSEEDCFWSETRNCSEGSFSEFIVKAVIPLDRLSIGLGPSSGILMDLVGKQNLVIFAILLFSAAKTSSQFYCK